MFNTTAIKVAACAFLLAGCAAPDLPVKTDAQKAAYYTAQVKEVECGKRWVQVNDDGISDAQTVALALYLSCAEEYDNAIEAAGWALLDNGAQRQIWRRNSTDKDRRIADFLPIVMDYRKNSRSKK